MLQITHFIALGSFDVPEQPIEVVRLPLDPDALKATLETALDQVGAFKNPAVQVLAAVVPVVSDGPPEPKIAAAIAWLTFHGRMQAIEEFEYGVETWLQPIIDRVVALKPDIPGPETLASEGGLTLRL